MKRNIKQNIKFVCLAVVASVITFSCANMQAPTGGSYDLDPPVLVKVTPKMNATNITGKKIDFVFDENVVLVKQSEKVIVTPPQTAAPIIRSANNKVTVILNDSLVPNTTYTIDFTDAITDNNQGNPLENFSYTFSTGEVIDTMSVSGTVLEANNLEPAKSLFVGLHSNMSDTAFTKTKFLRISRTNEQGQFTIRGVAPGEYKLYALDDMNRDYKYDNPAEAIAFMDTVIIPSVIRDTRQDTIKTVVGNHSIDSIKTIQYTRYLPDNVVLRVFKSDFQRKYLAKSERIDSKISLYFGAPTEMSTLEPLNFDVEDWGVLEKTEKNDTLTYWIKDKSVMDLDTLVIKVNYLKTDTLNMDVQVSDTIHFVDRALAKKKKQEERNAKRKKKNKEKEPEIQLLALNCNLSSVWDVFKQIQIEFGEPVSQEEVLKSIQFGRIVDSVYTPMDIKIDIDTLNTRIYHLSNKWEYGAEYELSIDSAAITSIYGLHNNLFQQKFKVKTDDEYGHLAYVIKGIDDSVPAFVELLNKSDVAVRQVSVKEGAAVFRNLPTGEYCARIIIDKNNNGKWDTGDYEKNLQPELVCYNQKIIRVPSNFRIKEEWLVDTLNLVGQKPLEITKNKPKTDDDRRKRLEEEEAKLKTKQKRKENARNKAAGIDPNSNMNRTSDNRRR